MSPASGMPELASRSYARLGEDAGPPAKPALLDPRAATLDQNKQHHYRKHRTYDLNDL
jgi:hypothetical protein